MAVIQIVERDIATAVKISMMIPELKNPHRKAEYHRRLDGVPHSILVALIDGHWAGFKVGYEREDYFYSWMGGVLPVYRRKGVATALQRAQEIWVQSHGYARLVFKTRNYLKGMLIFGLKNGFDIIGVEKRDKVAEHRILLQKKMP